MSDEMSRDPRTRLAREKFFSLRPKPLERWLWQQGLPASAERVFWYHWDLGYRNGTWLSQVPIRVVGRDCCLDPATVTRAYQLLRRLELLKRVDPGRDLANPFQQATAVTEVRIPRALLTTLGQAPNRHAKAVSARTGNPAPPVKSAAPPPPVAPRAVADSRAIFARLSAGERVRFAEASRERRTALEFDADTRLGPEDRAHVLATLESLARARPAAGATAAPAPSRTGGPRRLAALELLRIDRALRADPASRALAGERLREVVYAVEEGALARFAVPHAINVALKKIREGAWSAPARMPPDWALRRAWPESCKPTGGF